MAAFDDPFDPEVKLSHGCSCGRHATAAEHDAAAHDEEALQGRVVVYDYTAHREDVERQIGRSVVEHVSRGSLDADATARATDALCGHQRRTGPIPIRNVRTRSVS